MSSFYEKFKTNLDDWLYVLKHSKVKEDSSIKCKDLIEEKLQLLRLPLDVRNEYIRYQKQLQTYVDATDAARDSGKEEGEKIGLEKGKREGRKEAELSMARGFIAECIEVEIISKITGLSKAEIEKLKSDMGK